jgi:ribonucleoside-diphosphate reductase alpha subunit
MNVIKRDGTYQSLSFDKITNRIAGLTTLNPVSIAKYICGMVYDNVHTNIIDDAIASYCASKVVEDSEYQLLASKIVINSHTKNTTNFYDTMKKLYEAGIVTEKFFKCIPDNIDQYIDYSRDYLIDYFGFKTLEKSYLLKIGDKVVERPQHLWMRVAIHLHSNNLEKVLQTYEMISTKQFIHATPTLFNAGCTGKANLSSCYLLGMDDSLEGIFECITDCAKISKWAGGLGVGLSNIRSKNSIIKGTGGSSSGIIPLLKMFDATGRFINQGGKRMGSIACYLEPHHDDIFDFLNAKKHIGNDEDRARNLFYALWISDLFMKRVRDDLMWSLFSPSDANTLIELYGDEYEQEYLKLEQLGIYRRQVKARDVWKEIMTLQIETGGPYILYKDSINMKSNQQNIGIIKNSNLCAEIMEVSDDTNQSNCNLASICLPSFIDKESRTFNFKKMGKVIKAVVENLNIVIDINNYPTDKSKNTNLAHRPIGIGVQGLADVFMMMDLNYDGNEARELNRKIFEYIYYYAMKSSMILARESGKIYSYFEGSPLSEGKFQFDLWGVKPSLIEKFDKLRKNVIEYGVVNSLLIALMPTASTSQIFGVNSCFEPIISNIYNRRVLSGEFTVINHHLMNDLKKLNLNGILPKIIENGGSVLNIDEIPIKLKNKYKTAYEIKQKVIIDLAADRAPFVCQSQSMNLFFENANHTNLTNAHFYGWKNGLKTGSYYIRSKPAIKPQKIMMKVECNEDVCTSCSS